MKSTKPILLGLAGAWMALLLIDKLGGTAARIHVRRKVLPLRLFVHAVRMFKSLVVAALVVANVFMAIAIVDDRGGERSRRCC